MKVDPEESVLESPSPARFVAAIAGTGTDACTSQVASHLAREYAKGLVASVRHPLLVLDARLRVMETSVGFCQLFQVAFPDIEGRRVFEISDGEWEIPALHELLDEKLPSQPVVRDFEIRHQFGKKGIKLLRLDATLLQPLPEVEPVIVLAIDDITQPRRPHDHLVENEERFRTAVSLVSGLIWTNNAAGMMEGEQPGWANFTGQAREDYQGYGWSKAVHPEDAGPTLRAWQQAVEKRGFFETESRVRRYDGEWRLCAVRAIPLFHADGSIREWVGIHRDITESKRSEEILRASEERFRAFVTASSEVVYRASADWKEVWQMNDHGSVPDAAGRSSHWLEDFIFPEDQDEVMAVVNEAIRTCQPFSMEHRVRRTDGTAGWVSSKAIPMLNKMGEIIEWFGAASDVTQRRELENRLVERAEDLALADRRKDEFLAMLAHELRNPLAPLRNAAEILRLESVSSEAGAEAQQVLHRQTGNMTRLIEDLLDVSRINQGKIELRPERISIETALKAAAEQSRIGICERKHQLTMEFPDEPILLHADPTRLDQIFGNLITNACKYSAPGSRIWISAERKVSSEEKPEVLVRVRDEGVGIEPRLLPHIFELFVQATRSLDRSHGGLGIGLTLVQRLVKLHGGSVAAHSEGIGKGSEFEVRLPILPDATPDESAQPAPQRASEAAPRRILIVDDNKDSACTMAMLQELEGHETRTAFNGDDAISIAAEFRPEIVLLDIGLPGMDGYEVARHLRSMSGMDDAFLVAISGYGSSEDIARAHAAGFDEHLVKPADLEKLSRWIADR